MHCPACQSKKHTCLFTAYDILYRMVDTEFTILKCDHCGALFLSPFPTQQETEKFYPKSYYAYDTNEAEGFFEGLKKKIITSAMDGQEHLRFMDKVLVLLFKNKFSGIPLYRKENGRFLDIGCGSGKNLALLRTFGWDAYGIELDERAVHHAKSKGLQVEKSSLEGAQFGDMQFDSIRIWHVFEHLTDPGAALKKMKGLLAETGEIMMALPNTESWARWLFGRYWYGLDVPRHTISYSPKTLRMLLRSHGLMVTEIKYVSLGSFVGSISNFFRHTCGYQGNLINNLFLVLLFSPIDFLSDLMKRGDTIFLKIHKNG